MSPEREIRAKKVLSDIVSGRGDNEIMHKYGLTHKGLRSVYKKLLDANLIDPSHLKGRVGDPLYFTTGPLDVTVRTMVARLPRRNVYMPLPVQDASNPELKGTVIDISERGLGVKGLKVKVDEVKFLAVKANKFLEVKPFVVKAKCRWVKPGHEVKETQAGFEIISITPGALQQLRDLIEKLEYVDR